MKSFVALVFVLATTMCPADGGYLQSRLELQSPEDQQDFYYATLRKVFKRAYREDVVVSALFVPSFIPEDACGIFRDSRGYQAFAISPSASTWETEYERIMGYDSVVNRVKEECFETSGKKIPCPPHKRRKGVPISYRGIRTTTLTKSLSTDVAERIKQLWQVKLLEALHPPPARDDADRVLMLDGAKVLYSMRLPGYGLVAAEGILGDKGTVVEVMARLVEALGLYAGGNLSEEELKKTLRRAEAKN